MRYRWLIVLMAVLAIGACDDPVTPTAESMGPDDPAAALTGGDAQLTDRYIVLGRGNMLPGNLTDVMADAGGSVVDVIPQIGVAVVASDDPRFVDRAARVRGIESVTRDMVLRWTDPVEVESPMEAEYVPPSGDMANDAFFYSFQWAPGAVQAPKAWEMGYSGDGVRVAILDGGLWDGALDLAPNIDVDASASFIPGFDWNEDTGTFWHGTHVAGIVGATGQYAAVGIAPNATLIGVKVLHDGSGPFQAILNGIVHAALPESVGGAGADIINMSLGATLNYRDNWQGPGFREAFRELEKAYDRAVQWAYQQGVTVIASAGNGGNNYDVARELYKIPAESQQVVGVASTAPLGWALGGTDYYRPAYYSDHGKSLVDVAAPGGSPELFFSIGVELCTVNGTFVDITNRCYVFDYVLSTIRGSTDSGTWVGWAYGTSMAAPVASGVAALLIEANGGDMNPLAVAAALEASAIDYGKPGKDANYGHGMVNAARAVTR